MAPKEHSGRDSESTNEQPSRSKRARHTSSSPSASAVALYELHPDVLEAILQELGPVEASRVRAVSKKMRAAFDSVSAWRPVKNVQLAASSAKQFKRIAACIVHDGSRATSSRRPWLRLAEGGTLDVDVTISQNEDECKRLYRSVKALFVACSASSGGSLGGVCMTVCFSRYGYEYEELDMDLDEALERLVVDMLSALSSSCNTLKSISVECDEYNTSWSLPERVLQLLPRFQRLERLQLPYELCQACSSISAALPALRSASVRFSDGAALAAFGLRSHPALDELTIGGWHDFPGPVRLGFKAFAAGPAARRLRKLSIRFGSTMNCFRMAGLPRLGRLTSLETLDLSIHFEEASPALWSADEDEEAQTEDEDSDEEEQEQEEEEGEGEEGEAVEQEEEQEEEAAKAEDGDDDEEEEEDEDQLLHGLAGALGGLRKLRELDLEIFWEEGSPLRPVHLDGLTKLVTALRARSVAVSLRLHIHEEEDVEEEAVAELLRAAGPAFVDLTVNHNLVHGPAFAALAACPRLRNLEIYMPALKPPPPFTAIVDTLAACPRLARVWGLPVFFESEREARELRGPLRRLAAACSLGLGDRSMFNPYPSASLDGEERKRVKELAKESIRSVFPKAKTEY